MSHQEWQEVLDCFYTRHINLDHCVPHRIWFFFHFLFIRFLFTCFVCTENISVFDCSFRDQIIKKFFSMILNKMYQPIGATPCSKLLLFSYLGSKAQGQGHNVLLSCNSLCLQEVICTKYVHVQMYLVCVKSTWHR